MYSPIPSIPPSRPIPAPSCQAHLEHAAPDGAGAGVPLARRSSSRPPACCSGPEIHLRTASAGLSPIAENETEKGEAAVGYRRHKIQQDKLFRGPYGKGGFLPLDSPVLWLLTSVSSLPQTSSGAFKPALPRQPALISAQCLPHH